MMVLIVAYIGLEKDEFLHELGTQMLLRKGNKYVVVVHSGPID